MRVHANVVIQNESLILNEIISIWNTYPIDEWVFYDDNSTDDTPDILRSKLDAKVTILNDHLPEHNETHCYRYHPPQLLGLHSKGWWEWISLTKHFHLRILRGKPDNRPNYTPFAA